MPADCILRISSDLYEERVVHSRCYYTGLPRRWEKGATLFFSRKKEKGDSLIGHGIIEDVIHIPDLTAIERKECKRKGWKCKIVFGEDLRIYSKPIPVKEILRARYRPGRLLHGFKLLDEEAERILEQSIF